MVQRAIDAVYENGAFRPVHSEHLPIEEGGRVRITIDTPEPEPLQLALAVFEGLSENEIAAIEEIALDRRLKERCQEPFCPS